MGKIAFRRLPRLHRKRLSSFKSIKIGLKMHCSETGLSLPNQHPLPLDFVSLFSTLAAHFENIRRVW